MSTQAQIVGWKGMEYSAEAEKALQLLSPGQVMAVRVKQVKGGKLQIEFAEKITRNNQPISALSMFNQSDKRFQNGPRRTWLTAEKSDAMLIAGISLEDNVSHKEILEIMKPYNGLNFGLQITEKVESELAESQKEYSENYLKTAGKDGNHFFTEGGERVAQIVDLVMLAEGQSASHTYLEGSFKSSTKVVNNLVESMEKASSGGASL